MIVDAETLDVRPIADQLLHDAAGDCVSDVDVGRLGWSNELVLHVVELKTTEPAAGLTGLAEAFQAQSARSTGCWPRTARMLMPTAMHPWMNPVARDAAVAARQRPDLRGVRPHLRLSRPRLGQPAERALESARSPTTHAVRPAARGHPPAAADPARARRQLAR